MFEALEFRVYWVVFLQVWGLGFRVFSGLGFRVVGFGSFGFRFWGCGATVNMRS